MKRSLWVLGIFAGVLVIRTAYVYPRWAVFQAEKLIARIEDAA